MEVGISHDHGSYVDNGKYHQSDIFEDDKGTFTGIHLLLARVGIVMNTVLAFTPRYCYALGLKREDDVWVSPDEGYCRWCTLKKKRRW